jgi:alpha-mannosidase
VLEFDLRLNNSTIRQTVVLEAGSTRLDFKTEVDWHEEHKMLRTAFPVNVFSQEASFDIQYGYVKRPMHDNTCRDFAQFEVVGQRYADVSDLRSGVALLNDCKYGYKVKNSVIDLNLLRSSKNPDSTADQGKQLFTYSLLPHCGTLTDSIVFSQAALVNRAPFIMDGCGAGKAPVCSLESDSVTLEVVKKAEKEDCIVIRMLETKGESASGTLNLNGSFSVVGTNLMEWTDEEVYTPVDGKLALEFKPFEIKTLKLKVK